MRTNSSIINEIANGGLVEEIIKGVSYSKFENPENIKDLAQDIYLQMLQMRTDKLNDLYTKNQLRYWIARIVVNSIHSKTSPYFYAYKKAQMQSVSIDDIDTDNENRD